MNMYNPNLHHRRSIRLKGYDYSQPGLYFITICVQDMNRIFGRVSNNGQMILNDAGKMIEIEWLNLKKRFPNIELHQYVVMPNHFHAILEIIEATLVATPLEVTTNDAPTDKNIGDIIGAFKSITTVEYIRGVKSLGWQPFNKKLWQRDYYEHIIRNELSYHRISTYIQNNPSKWLTDKFHKR